MADKRKNKEEKEVNWEDFTFNMSAALYLISEQQAVIGKLLEELVRVGALNTESLCRITENPSDLESLKSIYEELYDRYSKYVISYKNLMGELKDEDK